MRVSSVRKSIVPLSQFGRFLPLFSPRPTGSPPTLPPFPRPLPVPRDGVAVPHYVPRDFWGSPRLPQYPGRVPRGGRIKLGGEEERKLRAAAKLARDVLNRAGELVKVCPAVGEASPLRIAALNFTYPCFPPWKPGVTTAAIDKELHELILSSGAYPSPLGYKGFPKSICTSINNVKARSGSSLITSCSVTDMSL
jgi:methionyl aminopeptidase